MICQASFVDADLSAQCQCVGAGMNLVPARIVARRN
jgi:hypothetical protein